MPTTRKQKKARKSGGAEMLSDIEHPDNILRSNQLQMEESEYHDSSRTLGSPSVSAAENIEENRYPDSGENRSRISADNGHNSAGTNSTAEFIRLSGELNLRISREMDEEMNSVSVQIQRAINDAISNQVLPQIQNALRAGSGPMTQKGWNVMPKMTQAKKPEIVLEVRLSVTVFTTEMWRVLTTW